MRSRLESCGKISYTVLLTINCCVTNRRIQIIQHDSSYGPIHLTIVNDITVILRRVYARRHNADTLCLR